MSPFPVVLGLDHAGTEIAVAVCDMVGQRLAPAGLSSRGKLGARDSMSCYYDARSHTTATPSARRRPPSSLPLRRAGQPDRAPRRTHP